MRNGDKTKTETRISQILKVAKRLPFFTLDDLASVETDRAYLKVLLSRYAKSGKVARLKKGMYVSKEYFDLVEKRGRTNSFGEFLVGILYKPSYLSLEYVLHKRGVITESPNIVTAVSRNKTAVFSTPLGTYRYYSIREKLFTGFNTHRDGDYLIFEASLAKALFDFLYFRKYLLREVGAIAALRLNLDAVSTSERNELAEYVRREGSTRMNNILKILWKN